MLYESSGETMVSTLARFLSAREWSQFSSESGPKKGRWWEVIPCLLLVDRHFGSHSPWKIVTIPRHSAHIPMITGGLLNGTRQF